MSRLRRSSYARVCVAELETWEQRIERNTPQVLACNYGAAWCEGPSPSPRDGTIAPPVRCSKCTHDCEAHR
jgi:hypothetical protein